MITVPEPMGLAAYVGQSLGVTDWHVITQDQITGFAELTGDDHWIHVDVARAAREQPGGKTIAHGLYILALIPRLQRQIFHIARRGAGLNYGYEKVRFTAPVPVGASIRLRQSLGDVRPHRAGTRIELNATVEIAGADKPALIAQGILLIGDPPSGQAS
ncbi:MaoC family dehydratase [Phaeovulum sp. W22_SRMD_FR3]|uniref:MaoC family dehydratase n=1 Tax=Phaeovulum sp. W22_SRMD_FR3 TaxID=3240274 RepID=UPI003F9D1ADE